MSETTEIKLPEESDPDLQKIKNRLEGQDENSPERKAFSDLLNEDSLVIQSALLGIIFRRIKDEPGISEDEKTEFSDAINQSDNDLKQIRERIKENITDSEYGQAYTQLRYPCMSYINRAARKIAREQPLMRILGRVISTQDGRYEGELISKFQAIKELKDLNRFTTFMNNLNTNLNKSPQA